jgi:hypothetical protein
MAQAKKSYESPALTVRGSVADLTRGNQTGAMTDRAFPIHTPKDKLTFS